MYVCKNLCFILDKLGLPYSTNISLTHTHTHTPITSLMKQDSSVYMLWHCDKSSPCVTAPRRSPAAIRHTVFPLIVWWCNGMLRRHVYLTSKYTQKHPKQRWMFYLSKSRRFHSRCPNMPRDDPAAASCTTSGSFPLDSTFSLTDSSSLNNKYQPLIGCDVIMSCHSYSAIRPSTTFSICWIVLSAQL